MAGGGKGWGWEVLEEEEGFMWRVLLSYMVHSVELSFRGVGI